MDSSAKIFAIVGPTASGKSGVGQFFVKRGYSVVNFDSCQLFVGLPILKAVPDCLDHHYLYQLFDYNNKKTVLDWACKCKERVVLEKEKGRIPVLIGGTGFYLKSLIEGVMNLPVISDDISEYVEGLSVDEVVSRLMVVDPASLKFKDARRLRRSLKIYLVTGKSIFSYHFSRVFFDFKDVEILALMPEMDLLRGRILSRLVVDFDKMVEEVRNDCSVAYKDVIGFKEICMLLDGKIGRNKCLDLIFYRTCQYAKRQRTYIRSCLGVKTMFSDVESLIKYICASCY